MDCTRQMCLARPLTVVATSRILQGYTYDWTKY